MTTTAQAGSTRDNTFFGHPRGLATLFFTEMWERFSYYGMRALLILFMVTATDAANPGLELDVATAGAIYGLYTSLVYILALPGGWVADNLWGQQKAIWVGGWIIALGHFTMAIPTTFAFFSGMLFIICGTGLLKPNVSTVVGDLYPEGGARRDAGFSIFYMGINIGAFFGPLVTGALGESGNWHWGFGAAGVGMVLGLIQYRMGAENLGEAGKLLAALGRAVLSTPNLVGQIEKVARTGSITVSIAPKDLERLRGRERAGRGTPQLYPATLAICAAFRRIHETKTALFI